MSLRIAFNRFLVFTVRIKTIHAKPISRRKCKIFLDQVLHMKAWGLWWNLHDKFWSHFWQSIWEMYYVCILGCLSLSGILYSKYILLPSSSRLLVKNLFLHELGGFFHLIGFSWLPSPHFRIHGNPLSCAWFSWLGFWNQFIGMTSRTTRIKFCYIFHGTFLHGNKFVFEAFPFPVFSYWSSPCSFYRA